ncbi:MAG TPA: hypothetical protein VKE74_28535 [Gemmataceae bacterium]|nr:hypothetical protein [Gemmataceae bacterium]
MARTSRIAPPSCRLGCEQLEARDNPAGNVIAVFSGFDFFVIGDANPNDFVVTMDGASRITVTGRNGTTVNGQASVTFQPFIPNNVSIRGMEGNDTIQVAGLFATNIIAITAGDENDAIFVSNSQAPVIGIDAQGGNDTVGLFGVAAPYALIVFGGTGFDTLSNVGSATNFPFILDFERIN